MYTYVRMHAVPTRVCKLHVSRYVYGRRTTRVPAHVRAHVCVRVCVRAHVFIIIISVDVVDTVDGLMNQ